MPNLSDRRIRDAKPGAKDRWLGDGRGLWVRIRANGRKTFILRTKRNGRTTVETLGEWSQDFLLDDARQAATNKRRMKKRHAVRHHTVGELAAEFYSRAIEPHHRRPEQAKRYLDRDLAPIANLKLSDVHRSDIADVVKKKTADGKVTANRLLAIIKQMLRFGVEIGWLETSPAELLTRRSAGGTEKARDRHLDDDEIRRLWVACETTAHGPLLRFLLLSGQRISEAQKARWPDVRNGHWYIDQNKSGRKHWIPVSSAMQVILDGQDRDRDLIFGRATNTGVQAWLRRWCGREKIPPFTPHDLRRTCATGINKLGFPPQIAEKILNHVMEGVMAIYNQHDYTKERGEALEAWGGHVMTIVVPAV